MHKAWVHVDVQKEWHLGGALVHLAFFFYPCPTSDLLGGALSAVRAQRSATIWTSSRPWTQNLVVLWALLQRVKKCVVTPCVDT